jgi:exonuclease SbcC
MRIVAIRGRDLASLKGPFAVELGQPPLSTLGLFAIHGPVGAGKSTILDAMTLGLFGRTPRLSGVGGAPLLRGDDDIDQLKSNDPCTLVRRGADSALAEVDFIGVDGRLYRARWEVRRGRASKGRPGRLQPDKQTLRDVHADVALGDGNTDVRRLVQERLGLSFDELCRSVLLAQGGFQSFLQAKPGERAALLERVTGTEIYSRLGMAAHERARGLEAELHSLQQQMVLCGVLDDDERLALQRLVVGHGSAAAAADSSVASLATAVERVEVQRECAQARAVLATAQQLRQATAVELNEARRINEQARHDLDVARPLLEAVRRTSDAAVPLRRALEVARVATSAADADAITARQHQQRARDDRDAAATLNLRLNAEVQRLEAGCSAVDPGIARAALITLAAALTQQERARANTDAAALAVGDARAVADAAEACAVTADAAVDASLPAGVDVANRDAVTAAVLDAMVVADGVHVARVDAELAAATAMVQRLEAALARQAADATLARARAELHDGVPCPVCGSETHPWSPAPTLFPGRSVGVDPVVQAIGDERHRLQGLQAERASARERLSGTEARRRRLRMAPASLTLPPTMEGLLALLLAIDAADDDVARAAAARQAVEAAGQAVDAARATHAVHVAHLEARDHAVDAALDAATALALVHDDDGDDSLQPAVLQCRADALGAQAIALQQARHRVDLAASTLRAASEAMQQADLAVVAKDAAIATAAAIEAERQRAADLANDAVVAAVAALSAAGLADVTDGDLQRAVDQGAAAVARGETAHAAANDAASVALARLRERADRLERLGGTANDDSDADGDADGDALREALAQARHRAVEAKDALAMTRAQLAHDDVQRHRQSALAHELASVQERGRVWLTLSQLIGAADGAKFRQFAQGLTLDALIGHANHQLRVLAPRYRLRRTQSLQQKHDLDLVIIDTEAGDDVRSTATLSGGEGFLVSLALALGLSSLSANEGARGRVESLFVDEGFSALDQDTLDVALAAFDALRQTGRQIGVVSHVPLLIERLGAQVRVIPMGGGASRVEVHAS